MWWADVVDRNVCRRLEPFLNLLEQDGHTISLDPKANKTLKKVDILSLSVSSISLAHLSKYSHPVPPISLPQPRLYSAAIYALLSQCTGPLPLNSDPSSLRVCLCVDVGQEPRAADGGGHARPHRDGERGRQNVRPHRREGVQRTVRGLCGDIVAGVVGRPVGCIPYCSFFPLLLHLLHTKSSSLLGVPVFL